MDLDAIRELIQLMKENKLSELDWGAEGRRIRIKAAQPEPVPPPPVAPVLPASTPLPPALVQPPHPGLPAPPEAEIENGTVVTSPIVGVFYRSATPEKPAFVEVGDEVDENTVLCIIEAMKVMNEIKAEAVGVVGKVLMESGQPVEYGQPLFVIDRPT